MQVAIEKYNNFKNKPKEDFVDGLSDIMFRFLEYMNLPVNRLEYSTYAEVLLQCPEKDTTVLAKELLTLELILKLSNFTEEERLEIFLFYYSRNYMFFSDEVRSLTEKNPEKKYKQAQEKIGKNFEKLKCIISADGKLLPYKSNMSDKEKINFLTINGFFDISAEMCQTIFKKAEMLYEKEQIEHYKRLDSQSNLNYLLSQIGEPTHKVSELEIKNVINLMRNAGYSKEEINNKEAELRIRLKQQNEKKVIQKKEINHELENKKLEAMQILEQYLNIENEPLGIVSTEFVTKLEEAMRTLNYAEETIKYILNNIRKSNNAKQEEVEQARLWTIRSTIFTTIDCEENSSELLSSSAINLYNNAEFLLSKNNNDNKALRFNLADIAFWVNYIDEIVRSILNRNLTPGDINEVKAALIEIEICLKTRLQVISAISNQEQNKRARVMQNAES